MLHSVLKDKTDSGFSPLNNFESSVNIVNFVYNKCGRTKSVTLCSIAVVMYLLFACKK